MFVENALRSTQETAFKQTECTTAALTFQRVAGRVVLAPFDGGTLTPEGGAVLLREENRANLPTLISLEGKACQPPHVA